MLYPKNIKEKLGFDKIEELVSNECISSLGRSFVGKIRFSADYKTVLKLIGQTEEFRQILLRQEIFPIDNYFDPKAALEMAAIEGTFLSVEQLHKLRLSLTTIFGQARFLSKNKEEYPELGRLISFVYIDESLVKTFAAKIDDNGQLKDNASTELANIRSDQNAQKRKSRKSLDQILKKSRSDGFTPDDASLTVRGGRMVIPVYAEYKRRIKGFIHDESSTGQLVYMEPAEVLETNNFILELEYRERREVIRILTELTDMIRPHIPALKKAYDFMGMVDFIRAKARFAIRLNAQLPEVNDASGMEWRDARHPLLALYHESLKKEVVPLNVEMNPALRVLLISGPNAGGKSVCLKTVGLLQYMLQAGLLIPMEEGSKMRLFDSIFLDIGDEQSLEDDLSTYSSHLNNMKNFLKHADEKSLILIDEFGSGTDPQFGAAIAESILEALNQREVFGVITTHYANLKKFAKDHQGIENCAMKYDLNKLEPLYELEIGKPGSSFALEIARKIGLPVEILQQSEEKVGVDQVNFDKLLRQLERDKRKYQDKLAKIKGDDKKLKELIKEYEEKKENIVGQRKEIINQAKEQATALLSSTNQKIERTIREIKEKKADKQATRAAREKLEKHKEGVKPGKRPTKKSTKAPIKIIPGKVKEGDFVIISDSGATGEILSIKGNTAEIAIGNLVSKIKVGRLKKVSKGNNNTQEAKVPLTKGMNLNERMINFSTSLDLRGKRAEEAIQLVENFVDQAAMLNCNKLRIVHGKGDGILRLVVRDYLKSFDIVAAIKDEHADRGGTGVSILTLK